MRNKLITAISLILVGASGCQKKSAESQVAAPAAATVEEATPAPAPTVEPLAAIPCLASSNIQVDASYPPNLGDACVSKNSVNSALTWQAAGAIQYKFKVEWTDKRPSVASYPYPLASCATFKTTCSSENVTQGGNYPDPTYAYYKVTFEQGGLPPMNGRIIIRP
jgi:hypothetical protein